MRRPFAYLAVLLMAGIYAGSFFQIPPLPAYIATLALSVLAASFFRHKAVSSVLVCIAVVAFGYSVFLTADIFPAGHISSFLDEGDKEVYLKGRITDDPVVSATFYGQDKASFVLEAGLIKDGESWRGTSGLVKVDLYGDRPPFDYGDEVLLEGVLYRPEGLSNPGLFDYKRYLSLKGILAGLKVKEWFLAESLESQSANPFKKAAFSVRRSIRDMLNRYLENPYRGFLAAILIGDRTGLSRSLRDDFVKTGTVHVIAISGLHVGLIASIILGILALLRAPKRINLVLTLAAVVFYAMVAGANPPVVRAVIMFAIFTIGYLARRDSDALNSLSLAAFLILLYDPRDLFNPGFQLSFVSVASIILLTPRIERSFGLDPSKDGRARLYTLRALSVSLAAWAGTWPIVAYYFNIVSPVAIAANLVVVPALALVTALSFAFLSVGGALSAAAPYLAAALTLVEKGVFRINGIFSAVPFAYFRIPAPPPAMIAIYYLLIFLLFMPARIPLARRAVKRNHIIILLLAALSAMVWRDAIRAPDEKARAVFFDVGRGDSSLVTLPGPVNILIDAGWGGDEDAFDTGRAVIAPYLWARGIAKLDAVVVTHGHQDHLGGMLYILDNFRVGAVIDNGLTASEGNPLSGRYAKLLKEKKIRHVVAARGDVIEIAGEGMYVLNPGRGGKLSGPNDTSLVIKMSAHGARFLYCADITSEAMKEIMPYGCFLESDILKVPHHGGGTGDKEAAARFFEAVAPRISIISADDKEPPKGFVGAPGSKIYTTGGSGAVSVTVSPDGNIEISENRKNN